MREDLTELVFILDRSGSMSGLEQDTIGGFNGMINKQKSEEGQALVSVVLFDDRSEVIYDRVDLDEIKPMTDKQYYVRGCTALLDAIGGAIRYIRTVRKGMRPEDRPAKTIFIITTDGMENSSTEFTYSEIKKMIEQQQQKAGWEFIFLGANIDAIAEAGKLGIKASRAVDYNCDSEGTALNYEVLNSTVGAMRRCRTAEAMSEMMDNSDCFAEIKADYKKRGKKRCH